MRNYALHYERVQLGTEPRHCPACVSCVHSANTWVRLGARMMVADCALRACMQTLEGAPAAKPVPAAPPAPLGAAGSPVDEVAAFNPKQF